jgi:heat shock protein HtpX
MGAGARTAVLMIVLTLFLLVIGYAIGWWMGNVTLILTIAFILAMTLNIFTYWYADKWVLKIYKAKIVSEAEEPELHEIVGRLATSAGLPKPRVAVVPSDKPNAFATGRNPSHAVVAVTRGAMSLLDKEQLEGVLGHEMAHVKNRDMLINTMAAMIAGVIAYVGFVGRFSLFFGGGRSRGGGAGILAILALILMPIAAILVRLSISRTREYGADEEGASISRKPRALASALRSLESAAKNRPMKGGNPATSHLFIVNPFRGGGRLVEVFSTHPSTEKRVRRLEEMAATGRF